MRTRLIVDDVWYSDEELAEILCFSTAQSLQVSRCKGHLKIPFAKVAKKNLTRGKKIRDYLEALERSTASPAP